MMQHREQKPGQMDLHEAALACIKAGLSIIPIDHATKRPAARLLPRGDDGKATWKPYQSAIVDEATAQRWLSAGVQSIAVVGGAVSGGLLVIDFDVPRFYDAWKAAVGELADGLPVQQTGGGGYQVLLRCPNPGGNDKLAWARDEAEATGRTIAIETRGEGGYAVVAPSLHPTGNRYRMVCGTLDAIPMVAQARADALLDAARKLDEAPHTRQELELLERQARAEHQRRQAQRNGSASVIDAFNAAHAIEALLERHGYSRGIGGRYIRPGGKSESVSVKDGRSCHWSSDDPLNDGKAVSGCGVHDAFDLYCHFEHGGDVKAAVKAAAHLLGMNAPAHAHAAPSAANAGTTDYTATESGIFWQKPTRHGSVLMPLTNFTAGIVADVTRDDGTETEHAFEIVARLAGEEHRFILRADEFSGMNWPIEHMGARAIVYPGMGNRDHARAAIQFLSEGVIRRTIYTHTGWRQIGGAWVFLHGGGAIGAAGPVTNVEVVLPDALKRYLLPVPPAGDELVRCIKASLRVLDVGPQIVTLPNFAAVYRAALGGCDGSSFVAGPSGSQKSELSALCVQHYGAGMDRLNLPCNWASTENALEGLAFAAKDVLLGIDDFAPNGSMADVQRLHAKAERIIRAQGNHSGRQRMRADSSLRPTKPPRGMILSTGEDIPKGHSLRARLFITEVNVGDIDLNRLTGCQADGAAGLYAGAMAGYVQWLAPKIEQVQAGLKDLVARFRAEVASPAMHGRTPDLLANLAIGLRYSLDYATDAGAVTKDQADQLWQRGWAALKQAGSRQTDHQMANEPTRRFAELLASALASGRAHLADRDGAAPENATAWGWRKASIGTGAYARDEWQAQGDRVGWIAEDGIFLEPDAAYRAAQGMAAGGDGLVVSAQTLRKRLDEKGMVIRQGNRAELLSRRVLEGAMRSVLHMSKGFLSGQSTIPTIDPIAPLGGPESRPSVVGTMVESAPPAPAIHHSEPPSNPHDIPKNGDAGGNGGNGGSAARIATDGAASGEGGGEAAFTL